MLRKRMLLMAIEAAVGAKNREPKSHPVTAADEVSLSSHSFVIRGCACSGSARSAERTGCAVRFRGRAGGLAATL